MKHEDFLAAIMERPSEEALRRIYADWLEERGDPRAELIRIHWQLYKDLDQKRPVRLQKRESKLRRRCDPEWLLMFDRANWKQLYEKLPIGIPKGHEFQPPNEAEVRNSVDFFEKQTHFRFPTAYKAFLYVFGPGTLCNWWSIAVPPGGMLPIHKRYNLLEINSRSIVQSWRSYWDVSVERFIVFAVTGGGDQLCWDRTKFCDKPLHEYRILLRERADEQSVAIAQSFREFIYLALSRAFEPEPSFHPERTRKKPKN